MARTRYIYRVEHIEGGKGMFQTFELLGALREDTSILERHFNMPNPYSDRLSLTKDGFEWFCAYKSLKDLTEFVKEGEFRVLDRLGFKVIRLKVENFQVGEYQVVYTKESVIEEINITNRFIK